MPRFRAALPDRNERPDAPRTPKLVPPCGDLGAAALVVIDDDA